MEDFYALLQTSWNIRESLIGPFLPLPEWIFERLSRYNDTELIMEICQLLVNYVKHEVDINEYVSLKMADALPFIYDRFLVFLVFRPTNEYNQEPIVDLAEKVRKAYQTIIKPGGTYEKTKEVSEEFDQMFKEAGELKNATQKTVDLLFAAYEQKNEQQCRVLKDVLSGQLDKLIEQINQTTEKLRKLDIKVVLNELSTVHKELFKNAREIFHDEFKGVEGIDDETQEKFFQEYSLDSFHVNLPSIFQQSSESSHSRVFCTLVRLMALIVLIYVFVRFNKCFYSLCIRLWSKSGSDSRKYGKVYQKL